MAWIMIAMEKLIALTMTATAEEAAAQISTEIASLTPETSSMQYTLIIIQEAQHSTITP